MSKTSDGTNDATFNSITVSEQSTLNGPVNLASNLSINSPTPIAQALISATQPNLAPMQTPKVYLGKDQTQYDSAIVQFEYISNASSANNIQLGTTQGLPLTVDGLGNTNIAGNLNVTGSINGGGGGGLNAATLLGKTWASPDPIGSTTPSAGTFTSLTNTSSTPAPTYINQINSSSNAAASSGIKTTSDASEILMEMTSSNNATASRGRVRTSATAFGLDLEAQGSSKSIRLRSNNTDRVTIQDTIIDLSTKTTIVPSIQDTQPAGIVPAFKCFSVDQPSIVAANAVSSPYVTTMYIGPPPTLTNVTIVPFSDYSLYVDGQSVFYGGVAIGSGDFSTLGLTTRIFSATTTISGVTLNSNTVNTTFTSTTTTTIAAGTNFNLAAITTTLSGTTLNATYLGTGIATFNVLTLNTTLGTTINAGALCTINTAAFTLNATTAVSLATTTTAALSGATSATVSSAAAVFVTAGTTLTCTSPTITLTAAGVATLSGVTSATLSSAAAVFIASGTTSSLLATGAVTIGGAGVTVNGGVTSVINGTTIALNAATTLSLLNPVGVTTLTSGTALALTGGGATTVSAGLALILIAGLTSTLQAVGLVTIQTTPGAVTGTGIFVDPITGVRVVANGTTRFNVDGNGMDVPGNIRTPTLQIDAGGTSSLRAASAESLTVSGLSSLTTTTTQTLQVQVPGITAGTNFTVLESGLLSGGVKHLFGKAASTGNTAVLEYTHVTNGSTSNSVALYVEGRTQNIIIDGVGTTITGNLTVTGTASIGGGFNATTLLTKTWAVPDPIGSTTPNTGAFTTLASTQLTVTVAGSGGSTTASSMLQPALSSGFMAQIFGKANTLNNSGYLSYIHSSDGSTNNSIQLNLQGNAASQLAINGTGTAITGNLSVSGTATLTASNASQLLTKTWAIPDPIGSTTPNTGAFTSITGTSLALTVPGVGSSNALTLLQPALANGSFVSQLFGKANTTNNCVAVSWVHSSDGSALNALQLNLQNNATSQLRVNGTGTVITGALSVSGASAMAQVNITIAGSGGGTVCSTSLQPALASSFMAHIFGKANTLNNSGYMSYVHSSDGSALNAIQFNLQGNAASSIVMNGTGTTITGNLTVSGTFSAGGLNATTLLTKTWAVPDPIGSTTPNTGSFTTLASTQLNVTVGGSGGSTTASSMLQPALSSGFMAQRFGKAVSLNNSANLSYVHSSDGSASNSLQLNLEGNATTAINLNGTSTTITGPLNVTGIGNSSQYFSSAVRPSVTSYLTGNVTISNSTQTKPFVGTSAIDTTNTNSQGQDLFSFSNASGWWLNISGRELQVQANMILIWDGFIGLSGSRSSAFVIQDGGGNTIPYGLQFNGFPDETITNSSYTLTVPVGAAVYPYVLQTSGGNLIIRASDNTLGTTFASLSTFRLTVLN